MRLFPACPLRADGQNHSEPIADWRIHLCWTTFGLAFLTKGPPALLPLLCLLPWHWWRFRNLRIFSPPGLILFSVCAFSWFGLMTWKHPGLLSYYLPEEIVGRVATDVFDRNPFYDKTHCQSLKIKHCFVGDELFLLQILSPGYLQVPK